MTYVIHGATGAQGTPVVAALTSAGKPVTAVARDASTVVDGARVVSASYSSVADLADVYRGAAGVFVHLPVGAEEDRQAFATNILSAIRQARPDRVVFSSSGFPLDPAVGGAVATFAASLAETDVSYAVIAPELYLENLLWPFILEPVRERGVLSYPIRADFPISWTSHLDVADVAAALLDRPDVTGVVSVGQYPAITGPDLAEAFGVRLGRDVVFESITPEEMGAAIAPKFGEAAAAGVVRNYRAMSTMAGRVINPEASAQKVLGITPRTTGQWLADIGL
ncbi:MAG TPA: NAD(P)H-binding protein [Pseudonocardiaceae bacterium]|nr:NAD(P)H-binding protein [Pseudonocardiaceae bacterium]